MVARTNVQKIIVLSGLPFSGKTTYAKSQINDATCIISRDQIIEEIRRDMKFMAHLVPEATTIAEPISRLYSDRLENAKNDVFTREYVQRVTDIIRKSKANTVIVDGIHGQALSRSFIQAFPDVESVAVAFHTQPDVCIARYQSERKSLAAGVRQSITPDFILALARVLEWPTMAEGFHEVIHH